jgi:hypothetical protein
VGGGRISNARASAAELCFVSHGVRRALQLLVITCFCRCSSCVVFEPLARQDGAAAFDRHLRVGWGPGHTPSEGEGGVSGTSVLLSVIAIQVKLCYCGWDHHVQYAVAAAGLAL